MRQMVQNICSTVLLKFMVVCNLLSIAGVIGLACCTICWFVLLKPCKVSFSKNPENPATEKFNNLCKVLTPAKYDTTDV